MFKKKKQTAHVIIYFVTSILQIMKLEIREMKQLAPSHTISKWELAVERPGFQIPDLITLHFPTPPLASHGGLYYKDTCPGSAPSGHPHLRWGILYHQHFVSLPGRSERLKEGEWY